MKIEITQEIIDRSKPMDPCCCILALSLPKTEGLRLGVFPSYYNQDVICIKLFSQFRVKQLRIQHRALNNYIFRFDKGKKVEPRTFILKELTKEWFKL